MIMKQEMQKSISKIQTAVETLTRQKVIDKKMCMILSMEKSNLFRKVWRI